MSGHSKLTRGQAMAIRESYQRGQLSCRDLAGEYGVSDSTISLVLRGVHGAVRGEPDIARRRGGFTTGDATTQRRTESPSGYQVDHRIGIPTSGLRLEAYDLVDRKFTGPKRAELRKWIYSRRDARQIRGLMARIEPLPDVEQGS